MGLRASRPTVLLWLGAAAGLAAAISTIASPPNAKLASPLPAGVVATVNGVPIPEADYERALKTFGEYGQRATIGADDKRRVLQRLIDDELMIEYGLQFDMARGDQPTRHALLNAVFSAESAAGAALAPTSDELERYYQQIRPELEHPGDMRLHVLLIRVGGGLDAQLARERAEQAVGLLRSGTSFAAVQADLATPGEAQVPDRLLSVSELGQRLGPLVLDKVLALRAGDVSDVLGTDATLRVVQVVERRPAEIPSLDAARDAVLARYRRQRSDEVFADKIASLRAVARIHSAETLP
jgi:PPIC-type PPIASE domain